ncbi:MAG: PAAR domain-containing protein, partial [Zoogloeaceae bacterium]|nr:PAAR domain-containing protein [Zoogloeaceae bacterium]
GKRQILVGDATTHGGVVVTGSPFFDEDGIPVARKGDTVTCPLCEPHVFVIAEGMENCLDHGLPIAVEGHKTTCGAKLIASGSDSVSYADGSQAGTSSLVQAPKTYKPYTVKDAGKVKGLGGTFDTMDDAAIDAVKYSFAKVDYQQRREAMHSEFGGWIYLRPEGKYSYTLNKGGHHTHGVAIRKPKENYKALWHTHLLFSPDDPRQVNDFSIFFYDEGKVGTWEGDIVNADRAYLPSYLGAPNGNVYKYTPKHQVTGKHDGVRRGTTSFVAEWKE